MKKFILILLFLSWTKAWPSGAPKEACKDFTPQHQDDYDYDYDGDGIVDPLAEETAEFDLRFAFGFKRSKPSGTGIAKSSPKGEVHLVVSSYFQVRSTMSNRSERG